MSSDEWIPCNKSWTITASYSLLNSPNSFANSENKKLQKEFDKYESKKFNQWKNNAWKELTPFMDYNAFQLVAIYSEISVANYYQINTKDNYYDGGSWVEDILESQIPDCLLGKVEFGDVVEVPGYRGSGVYVVNDVDNNSNSLIQVGQNGSGQIVIPSEITDQLCDPISFYRFCSPTQCLDNHHSINFTFNHSYIQNILGIRDEVCVLKYSLYQKCHFSVDSQRGHEPAQLNIYLPLMNKTMTVPIMYTNRNGLPLICYVEELYNKYLKATELKTKLKIIDIESGGYSCNDVIGAKLPFKIQQNLFIINVLVETDKSGSNEFEIELKSPVSWCISYPSVSCGEFVGMKYELNSMREFIKSTNYIHLCYGIEETDFNYDTRNQPSFCDLNRLISAPNYGIAWTSIGGYSLVTKENMNIATGILRGMKLCGYPNLKWKILKPIVTLKEYKIFSNRKNKICTIIKPLYSDIKCVKLVSYLLKYHGIARKLKKFSLSKKEHQSLMKIVKQILN